MFINHVTKKKKKALLNSFKKIQHLEELVSANNVKHKKRSELKWKKVLAFLK